MQDDPKTLLQQAIDRAKDEGESNAEYYEAEKPLVIRQEEFIKDELGYQFRYNTVRDTFEYSQDGGKTWADVVERVLKTIRRHFKLSKDFRGRGETPGIATLYEIVDTDNMAPNFNPFEAFFDHTKWDGTDRISALAATVTVEPIAFKDFTLPEVWPKMLRQWLVSATACALTPHRNEVMLLFISEAQGKYKTTWLNNLIPPALGPQYMVAENLVLTGNNNQTNYWPEKFLWNIDDQLDSIFGKEFNLIKGLMSKGDVTNRKSFRRDDKTRMRRVSFVGSVNKKELFKDYANRRFLTFEIASIDRTAALAIDMNQVFAQAYQLLKTGDVKPFFSREQEEIINTINGHYTDISAEEEWFGRLFFVSDKTDPQAIFYLPTEVLSIIKKASGLNVFPNNLAIGLKRLGITKQKHRPKSSFGTGSPRDGFWLRENFVREGDRVYARGEVMAGNE